MAYSNPSAPATASALMTAVSTFAVAQGWTQDNYDGTNLKMSLHKGNCYVHFWWNDEGTNAAYPKSIAMYQSLGYISAGTTPWGHTDDSGIGVEDTASPYDLAYERGIKYIGPGPYTSLHCFGHSNPDVLYFVLEFTPGLYRHFSFGNIQKAQGLDWTGGEFCAGHHWAYTSSGGSKQSPTSPYHSLGMDGVQNGYYYGQDRRSFATLHVEGLPDQETGTGWKAKWGGVGNMFSWDFTDMITRDGDKVQIIGGGMRNSMAINQLGWLRPNLSQGFIPIIPCDIWYRYDTGTTSDDMYYLGKLPHMGTVSLYGIEPQQVVTIGTDDWMAFPAVRKSNVAVSGVEESKNMGIIYMK